MARYLENTMAPTLGDDWGRWRMDPSDYLDYSWRMDHPREPFTDDYWKYSMANKDDDNATSIFGGNKLNLLFASGLDLLKGLGGSENALMGNMNYPNNTGMEMQRRPDMETQRRQDEMYRDMLRAQQPYGQYRR